MPILAAPTAPAQQIALTIFPDVFGKACTQENLTFGQLAELICKNPPTAATKQDLPLLKLATFGDVRTDAGSLRHDANVTGISGCELDYDGEEMPIEIAFQKLLAVGVESILYTSPSYTPDKPRWRVLAPFKTALTGTTDELRAGRNRCVAMINGVLGGVVAPESFALSQAFYFGRVGS